MLGVAGGQLGTEPHGVTGEDGLWDNNIVSGLLSLARDDQLMVRSLALAWPTPTIPATDSSADQSQHSRLSACLGLAERGAPGPTGSTNRAGEIRYAGATTEMLCVGSRG